MWTFPFLGTASAKTEQTCTVPAVLFLASLRLTSASKRLPKMPAVEVSSPKNPVKMVERDFVTCRFGRISGITQDGGYADYMIVPFEVLA